MLFMVKAFRSQVLLPNGQCMLEHLSTRRIYESRAEAEGYHVLVDGMWPRGISKADANIDEWLKDIAPSTELRRWFAHDPDKWPEFRKRYFRELDANPEAVKRLIGMIRQGPVTLVYAARDTEHNNARVLKTYLEGRLA